MSEFIIVGIHYCPKCEKHTPTTIVEKEETYNVLGIEDITITASVRTCDICKFELWDNYYDNQNLLKVYRIFSEKHPDVDFQAKKYLYNE